MSKEHIKSLLPDDLRANFRELWEKHRFELKIRKPRKSKLGDFRWEPSSGKYTITLNKDLDAPLFTVTFLHEFAHLLVKEKYGRKASPHGAEWKSEFSQLLARVQDHEIFDDQQKLAIQRIRRNPKASLGSDQQVYKAFKKSSNSVSDLMEGTEFLFRNTPYRVEKRNRSRSICKNLKNGKKYSFPFATEIELADNTG